ncbi:MAG TPA: prohibitin family protein, partial [Candidatus Kapabacteria bacterium]|nr:prohibitin family protein [Candidatus Kapabacteria bacterium]
MMTTLFFLAALLLAAGLVMHFSTKRLGNTPQFSNPLIKLIGPTLIGGSILLLVLMCITKVPNGHVGIISNFGKVSDHTLDPGLAFVAPWSDVIKLSAQTLEIKEDMQVPTKEGLTVGLETSVLWHINPRKAAILYRTVGEDYWDVLITPNFRSVVRGVTSAYDAKALYTSTRDEVQNKIASELSKLVEARGIQIEATPLRKITLPDQVNNAVQLKVSAEQEANAMEFRLLKERQEAERKI